MKLWKKILKASLFLLVALTGGYLLLLCFPQPLFAYQYTGGPIVLYSDDPIPMAAGAILLDAQTRLGKCPLYRNHPRQNIFLCNQPWRYKFFFYGSPKSGGLCYGFPGSNVFLRKSDITHNVLFRQDGQTSSGLDRPLSYFIAHEITHNLTARFTGVLAFWRLPVWIREGYADYVGKGGDFDFNANRSFSKRTIPLMDPSVRAFT